MTRSYSRSVVVDATPAEVFAVLADPRRHADFDGSGTVKGNVKAPAKLGKGARFGMRMRMGVPYTITNEVVEFEQDRRIAWRHVGHHVWRYELEAVDGGTQVTETFDWSTSRAPKVLELLGMADKSKAAVDATLPRLQALFTTR